MDRAEQDIVKQDHLNFFSQKSLSLYVSTWYFPFQVVNNFKRTARFLQVAFGLAEARRKKSIDGLLGAIYNLLLVDPVVGGLLPALELLGLEPESDLLLGRLDGVGAVADVAADVL